MNIDFNQVIAEIEKNHCGACKFGLAMKALRDLQGIISRVDIPAVSATQTHQAPPAQPVKRAKKFAKSTGDFEKSCKKCHVTKPLSEYPKNKQCRDGHTGECLACTSDRAMKNYRARRARKSGTSEPLTPALDKIAADTKNLRVDSRFRCEACHCSFGSKGALDQHNEERHTA